MNKFKIAIIGLGYVGLPLAIAFGKKYKVLGYDTDESRISQLSNGIDHTNEAVKDELLSVINQYKINNEYGLKFSNDTSDLLDCNIFIVTVPTPLDIYKAPDLKPLIKASQMLGKVIKKNDIIIYESTVYPGCTEEDCVPHLEKYSGLKFNIDFFCGYSPERINPGDKINTLTKIKKVTSGSTQEVAIIVDKLYSTIIDAGTFMASSIKIAEASKVVENCQRDLNISFINELALIFDKINIDTNEVLEAAGTKWNFLKFSPGLVGGHCIGVDPYYLAYKAQSMGYYPNVILSGRKINESMGSFIANKVLKLMIKNGINLIDSNVLILGFTFKENCSDIRNTKVFDIYNEFNELNIKTEVYDPIANNLIIKREYGISMLDKITQKYDVIIFAVPHSELLNLNFLEIKKDSKSIIFDVKSVLDKKITNGRL